MRQWDMRDLGTSQQWKPYVGGGLLYPFSKLKAEEDEAKRAAEVAEWRRVWGVK